MKNKRKVLWMKTQGKFLFQIIGDNKEEDSEPDKMQVAGMRVARFKAWIIGKIKGLFTKRRVSAVGANPVQMVSFIHYSFCRECWGLENWE